MSRNRVAAILSAICLAGMLGSFTPQVSAQERRREEPIEAKVLPDFDIRTDRTTQPTAALAAEAAGPSAALRLATMVDAVGQPVRYSLGADGWPRSISSSAGLSGVSTEAPESIARRYLASNAQVLPFSADDVAYLRLRQRSSSGALRVLYFQQFAAGVPVHGSAVKTAIDADGRVRVATFAGSAPGIRLLNPLPALPAAQAARLALGAVQARTGSTGLRALPESSGRRLFEHPEGGNRLPVAVELVAFPMPGGQGRLAWRVFSDAGQGSYESLIAADDGQLLMRRNLVAHLGSGRVFESTPLGPSSIREFDEGWLPAEATVTTGNNVDAYADADSDDEPDDNEVPGLVDGRASSATQSFDFDPGTGANAGRLTRAAAVTSAFYHSNLAHDYFYELGFREAEGNFQNNNGDRGGLGDDAVNVEVHDSIVLNNARFLPRPDGLAPSMELGLWLRSPGAIKDFALDGTAVVHEYTHGVTTRAVGGPDDVSCLTDAQSGALGEGWSDYFAVSLYKTPVFGDYISGDLVNGIRGAAIDRNTRNYSGFGDPSFQVHRDGAVWASTLWDMHQALGAEAADSLIFRALALTPCDPTWVDARNAILEADDGKSRAQLWPIFAARGLGFAASAAAPNDAVGTVFNANFDLPPDLAAGNRAPQITAAPSEPAVFGVPYSYTVRSEDPDGDARTYELVSGPPGVQVNPATGEMTWPSPTFTAHRIQIAVTDGKGGRTLHGFQLRVEARLTPGSPIRISGASGSIGLALVTVPPDTDILQVRLRGGNGDADLILFSPDFDTEFSLLNGSNETLSIRDPAPGQWVARVGGALAYRDISLTADLLTPTEITVPGGASNLSDAESGELFYKVVVPPNTPLLRVTLTGVGDADLLLARGRVPLCALAPISLPCDDEESSEDFGSYEALTIENPQPGDYFLTIYAFDAFQDVAIRAAFTAPAAKPGAATDGAAFQAINSPGGIATLFGVNLADGTAEAGSLPLPKELAGARVIVDGIPAALFFVSSGQINFQFPVAIAPGSSATLHVLRNGELSDPIDAGYRLAAPQVFVNTATMLPVVVHVDGSLVTPENPARPGEALVVYFTGIGPVNNPRPDGEPAPGEPLSRTLLTPRATLGDVELGVLYLGLTPGYVGLSQANLQLPASLPQGSTAALVLSVGVGSTRFSSAPVNLPIRP